MSDRLFEPPRRFPGLPESGFQAFAIADRVERRRAIVDRFHPVLELLGGDLLDELGPRATVPLHAHLPRLDWPPRYQPFCTWLALSTRSQGYQEGAQLNVGVHADHVALRLGWDTAAPGFGRFEFLGRHGHVGPELLELASSLELRFRVYAAAPWPEGSRCVHESEADLQGSFTEVARRGVWWELGRRFELPAELPLVTAPRLGQEASRLFTALLPTFERA